ncbi:MAG: heme-binding domain-containing protein [Oligoflexales bacterium]
MPAHQNWENRLWQRFLMASIGLGFLTSYESTVLAHGNKHHGEHHDDSEEHETLLPAEAAETQKENIDHTGQVNTNYLASVKSIFQKSCANCHSNKTVYPWYYPLPGVKYLIDGDIAEAREHMEISNDFPFAGHGSPEEDLEAIRTVVDEGTMPPLSYRVMHPDSALSDQEKKVISAWVQESLEGFERAAHKLGGGP